MSTELFPIAPCGSGSLEIESLHSYFARLARAHTLSPVTLAKVLSHIYGGGNPSQKLLDASLYSPASAMLCGYGTGISKLVDALRTATGRTDLRQLTLLSLAPAASRTAHSSVKACRAWCPACMHEASTKRETWYDRLLWMLAPIERCPVHRIALRSHCYRCGKPQEYYHRTGVTELCWKCSESLEAPSSSWTLRAEPCFGERDCCELIEAIASEELTSAVPDAFGAFESELSLLCSPLKKRVADISPTGGTKRSTGECSRPSLATMLKRVHAAGVSLVGVLKEPRDAALLAGELEFMRLDLPPSARPRHPLQTANAVRERIELELRQPIQVRIPSFQAIAREHGASTGFVRHRFPALSKLYIDRLHSQRVRENAEQRGNVTALLCSGVLADYFNGRFRSQDEVVEYLVETCETSKSIARTQLKRALERRRELGEAEARVAKRA